MTLTDLLPMCALSLAVGAAGAFGILRRGGSAGLMDTPNGRSLHTVPTPKGGGIGILLAFIGTCLWLSLSWVFWVPAALCAVAGFLGDLSDLSPRLRLGLQFLAAGLFVWGVARWEQAALPLVPAALWCVFMVGTANFYNFMDGIDGIAGITAAVGFGLVALFATVEGRGGAAVPVCLSVISAAIGFLPFNLPKARVFMGDVGSVLLGFLFACLVFRLSRDVCDFLVLVAFLFPFYADELVTMAIRIRDGESLLAAHRRHLYQILAYEYGYAHWRVATAFGALQLLVGCAALYLGRALGALWVFGFVAAAFMAFAAVSFSCRRRLVEAGA